MKKSQSKDKDLAALDEQLFEVKAVVVRTNGIVLRRGHILTGREIGKELELLIAANCVVPIDRLPA